MHSILLLLLFLSTIQIDCFKNRNKFVFKLTNNLINHPFKIDQSESPFSITKCNHIVEKFKNKDVLIVGDGDFSFANALSNMKITSSLTASTKDNQDRLYKSFVNSQKNVESIIANGDDVLYGVDATNITISKEYDIVLWNFPHIVGKQNIKYNRLLIRSFLNSTGHNNNLLRINGSILISLCEGQSGTKAMNQEEWNHSW